MTYMSSILGVSSHAPVIKQGPAHGREAGIRPQNAFNPAQWEG